MGGFVRKVAKHFVFPMICVPGRSKSRLAKAAGAEPCGERSCEKSHPAVARSTSSSQNAKKLTVSDHFWKLEVPKMARRCGAKHIFKSKCFKKTDSFRPLFEVGSLNNGTRLWREVKMLKN